MDSIIGWIILGDPAVDHDLHRMPEMGSSWLRKIQLKVTFNQTMGLQTLPNRVGDLMQRPRYRSTPVQLSWIVWLL